MVEMNTNLDRDIIARGRANLRGAPIPLKEAAFLLGTTPDNLRGAIKRGALSAGKMGRDWFVTRKEVEKYRKEHRRGETS